MAPPSMVMYINSSIVNNILDAIWYDMLNIANKGAAEYGIISLRFGYTGSGGATMKRATAQQRKQQRHDKEGSGGATMKAAAAQRGRQNWRRDNEGSGNGTIKRAAAH